MFTTLRSVTARRFSRAFSLSMIAGLAMLGAAAPAFADHGCQRPVVINRPVIVRDTCRPVVVQRPVQQVVVYRHGDNCGCNSCFARHEYQRGFNRGQAAASNSGYRDGMNGKNFCDASIDELRDNTPAYRDGYLAAFKPTYRVSFERGRREAAGAYQAVVIVRR